MRQPDLFNYVAPARYPAAAGFKERETSRDAARAIESRAATLRDRCYSEFRIVYPAGLTADEVAARLDETVLAIRPRITELYKTETIEKTGERRANSSGMKAHVWRLAR